MMDGNAEILDFLIFGATGFTGMHCIPFAHKLSKENGRNLKWGIAGRSAEKLKESLHAMGETFGIDVSGTPIILADVENEESLLNMAKKTKILLNCVGPYKYFGEPVIQACIKAGTHYLDITAEQMFLETLHSKYQEVAKEKGIYIIGACGFDCIPSDLGVNFVQKNFVGTLNSVIINIEVYEEGKKLPGPMVNYGTWESMANAFADAKLKDLLFPKSEFDLKPKLANRIFPHRPPVVDGWSLPFPTADRFVINQTQRYLYENKNKRPVQIDTQYVARSFFELVGILLSFLTCICLAQFECGKRLALNYPHILSGGMFRKGQNPTKEKIENTYYRFTFYGEGWNERLSDKNYEYPNPANRTIVGRVMGKNPAYGCTSACLVGSAVMLATERNKLPAGGGVYTPSVAFEETSLIQLLNENGVSFEILSQNDV